MSDKRLRIVLIVIAALLVLCLCLGAGVFVVRLHNRGDSLPAELFRRRFSLRAGHGAIGTVQGIANQSISIRLGDGTSQTVVVNKDTRIEKIHKVITLANLELNDQITVIGSPDSQGQIIARWIHVLSPSTPTDQVTPTAAPVP